MNKVVSSPVFFFPDQNVVHHSRPLPDLPSSDNEAGQSSIGLNSTSGHNTSGFSLEPSGNLTRTWTSRENLLAAAHDEDPQLFVALYDFQAGGDFLKSL